MADVLKSLIVYQIDYEKPAQSQEAAEQSPVSGRSPSFTEKIANGIQTRLMRRKSHEEGEQNQNQPSTVQVAWKKERVKYKFPFGQWCTGVEKIHDQDPASSTRNLYAASFFDQNFVIVQGQKLSRE